MTKTAFQKALVAHRDRVYGFAYYMLRDGAEAEDVTQEAYLRLWRAFELSDDQRLLAWILRVTHNLCIDTLRRRKTAATRDAGSLDMDLDALASPSSPSLDPHLQCELSEDQQALMAALGSLPHNTRSMLLLHYFQGLSYPAVGEALELSTSAVKVAVHRARKLLREMLASRFPERARRVSNG
jgi:RNA polymerase sigma factor (sigma-70 family)